MSARLQLKEFDPILVHTVEAALEPYKGTLSPEMLEHFREEALVLMSAHPYPLALIGALAKRLPASRSDDVPKPGKAPDKGKGKNRRGGPR